MWTRWFASADSPTAPARRTRRCTAAADPRPGRGHWCRKDVESVEAPRSRRACPAHSAGSRVWPHGWKSRGHDRGADRKARRRPGLADGVLHPTDTRWRARRQGPGEGGRGRRIGPLVKNAVRARSCSSRHHALSHEDAGESVEPFFIVGGPQVVAGIHPLDAVAELVDVCEHHGPPPARIIATDRPPSHQPRGRRARRPRAPRAAKPCIPSQIRARRPSVPLPPRAAF
jgi:hypothetical protein